MVGSSRRASERLRSLVKLPIVLYGEGSTDFISLVRREFGLGDSSRIEIVDQSFEEGRTLLFINFKRDTALHGRELGDADGVVVESGGSLTLIFDSKGMLESYDLEQPSEEDQMAARRELLNQLRANTVYIAARGEAVDFDRLLREGKTLVIQEDPGGVRRPRQIIVG